MKQRQHYVPQFYLRYFSDQNDKIYVLDLIDKKISFRNIKSVGYKRALYGDEDISEYNFPENYRNIVDKLEKKETLTEEEREILNSFLNNLIRRRPEFNNITTDGTKTTLDFATMNLILKKDAKESGADKIIIDGETHDISNTSAKNIDEQIEIVDEMKQKASDKDVSKRIFRESIDCGNEIFEWVKNGNYFTANSQNGFVTSNFFGGHSIFPISSNVCLFNKEILGELSAELEEGFKNNQDVEMFNRINKMIVFSPPHGNTRSGDRDLEIYAKEKKILQSIL